MSLEVKSVLWIVIGLVALAVAYFVITGTGGTFFDWLRVGLGSLI